MKKIVQKGNPVTRMPERFTMVNLTIQEMKLIQYGLTATKNELLTTDFEGRRKEFLPIVGEMLEAVNTSCVIRLSPKEPKTPACFNEVSKQEMLADDTLLYRFVNFFNEDMRMSAIKYNKEDIEGYIRANSPCMGHWQIMRIIALHHGHDYMQFFNKQL